MLTPGADGERGNLVVAMGIMLVLTTLSLALLARTLGGLTLVRRSQDYSAALAAAEAGLSEAHAAIAGGPPPSPHTANGTVGEAAWAYTATQEDVHRWTVRSTGTVNGVPHTVEATISREARYPYALFAVQDLTIDGRNFAAITTWTGSANVDTAAIGSNHAITINGGGGGARQDYYTPSGSCSGCPNPVSRPGPRPLDTVTPPPGALACPSSFTGAVAAGAYLCTAPVVFTGDVSLLGPVQIYVASGVDVSMPDATVNVGGEAADFRLFMLGSGGQLDLGNGSHAVALHGIVHAPAADVTLNGGQHRVRGSLTVNKFRVNGNPNFTLEYDEGVRQIPSDRWEVSRWREVPS